MFKEITMNFLNLVKQRFSCRDFLEKKIEKGKIEKNIGSSKISSRLNMIAKILFKI